MRKRLIQWLLPGMLLLAVAAGFEAQEKVDPLDLDTIEEVEVRLVILDTVVVDRQGRTVPDLTVDDFEILSAGEVRPIDTLDIACDAGAVDDPIGVSKPAERSAPLAPRDGRKVVLALDYLHLDQFQRVRVIEQALEMIENGGTAGDEIMIAALNGGLRIEQQFTRDRAAVAATLRRMQYDISLWQPDFFHLNEFGFVEGLTTLFDVLSLDPDNKGVVLFSAMQDAPLDKQFAEIAAVASSARCSIYPVDVAGLRHPPIPGGAGGRPGGGG